MTDDYQCYLISGAYLVNHGWKKGGSVVVEGSQIISHSYTKEGQTITYDGEIWRLNGNRINTINDIP